MRRAALMALAATATLAAAATPGPVAVTAHPEPLSALSNPDATLAANKRLVFDLWRTIVDAGHIEAADDMLAPGYIQHSPVLRTGRKAFQEIFSVVPRREVPELVEPPLVASLAEGNLVVMSLLERVPGRAGSPAYATAHFNLFRVEKGRLAEHWHSVHTPPGPDVPLPEDGGPQPVKGAIGDAQRIPLQASTAQLAGNKRLVFDLWREIVDAGHEDRAAQYVADSFVEHGANGGSTLEGFKAHFAARPDRTVKPWIESPVVAIVAEADLVALVTMQELPHPHRPGRTYTTTWFNLFRIAGGRVVEHWDTSAPGDPSMASAW
jgi:predicted SnoaL-like aldol condensation-catalyzing enzyme